MTHASPLRIAVVVGSTRPTRRAAMVAQWFQEVARDHLETTDSPAGVEVVDLAAAGLPLLDEPVPAAIGDYRHEHTRRWSATIASYDAFIFVTPEYNHSVPAGLKNAIDFLFVEWNDKAAGFVSYGLHGGTRAVEHLRTTLAEVKVACVRSQVALGLFSDFAIDDMTEPGTLTPAEHQRELATRMLDEVVAWGAALRPLRHTAAS